MDIKVKVKTEMEFDKLDKKKEQGNKGLSW